MFGDFFRGRYGIDLLSLILALAALILSKFNYLFILAIVLLGIAIFRTLSKDINKRLKEKEKLDQLINKIKQMFTNKNKNHKGGYGSSGYNYNNYKSQAKQNKQQNKTYVTFRCPKCEKTLRLPKNKGRLEVTCPLCKSEFLKKT